MSLIKPLVFGGIDGLTTTLAMVWGSIAAGETLVSTQAVIVLGVANLLATGLAMGIGDYVGTMAEFEAEMKVRRSETPLNALLSSPSVAFEDETKGERKSVQRAALRSGLTMFTSFISFGGLPLAAYLPVVGDLYFRRILSTALCVLSFFILGVARARIGGLPVCRTATNMIFVGSAASLMSFGASKLIHHLLVGAEPPLGG